MKLLKSRSLSKKGFTLVELLVVVSIIAVLAGLGLSVASMARNKAAEATAQAAVRSLSDAIDLYYDKYDELPLSEGEQTDAEKRTDTELMAPLCGLEIARDENPYQISFFEFKAAKGAGNNRYNGLYRTQSEAQLFGPWRTQNVNDRYYQVVFDYDYDKEIQEPATLGNEIQYGPRYLIYSYGRDGRIGQEYNVDNIYSWK